MWFNPIVRWLVRSPLHFFVSSNIMLMTTIGRKSGKSYTIPMNYLAIGDTLYTISSRERVWWRNMRGGKQVTLRLRGDDTPAYVEIIEGRSEVAEQLLNYFISAPQFARYMNVRINSNGEPNSEDIAQLAVEKIMVCAKLK